MNDLKSGLYDVDPDFQREYTKNTEWEVNMITHIVWTRQTGTLYFHPIERISENNEEYQVYECVDGKSRSNGIRNFMSDNFTIKDCGYPHLDDVVFSKWPLTDKGWFKRISMNIATCNRTLDANEISKLFQNLKTPSDCKTGELLNSKRNSPLLKLYNSKRESRPEFSKFIDEFWGNNERFKDLEIIAGLAHMLENPDDIYKPITKDLNKIWKQGITPENFDILIKYAMDVGDILKYGHVSYPGSGTVFFPFFRLFVMRVPALSIQIIKSKIDKNVFKNMTAGGRPTCVQERVEHLLSLV